MFFVTGRDGHLPLPTVQSASYCRLLRTTDQRRTTRGGTRLTSSSPATRATCGRQSELRPTLIQTPVGEGSRSFGASRTRRTSLSGELDWDSRPRSRSSTCWRKLGGSREALRRLSDHHRRQYFLRHSHFVREFHSWARILGQLGPSQHYVGRGLHSGNSYSGRRGTT